MKNEDSKLLLGLVVGVVVGAAVTYLATTEKREQLMEEFNNLADKIKDGYHQAVAKYKEGKAEVEQGAKEVKDAITE